MLTHKHMHTHTDVRETVGDRQNREKFDQSVCRKHFLAKGDINNIRVKVKDTVVKRHENDVSQFEIHQATGCPNPETHMLCTRSQMPHVNYLCHGHLGQCK